eukprot:3477893-Rhodomonas_salina.1
MLRARYAVPLSSYALAVRRPPIVIVGTERGYAGTAMVLCAPYAMSGTETGCRGIRYPEDVG